MALFLSKLNLCFIVGTVIIFGFLAVWFCYICLAARKKKSGLYVVENLPPKKSFFKKINIYRNYETANSDHQSSVNSERNLLESTDFSKGFSNSLLRINSIGSKTSFGSPRTYYSLNMSRTNSKGTFFSCSEGSDIGDIV